MLEMRSHLAAADHRICPNPKSRGVLGEGVANRCPMLGSYLDGGDPPPKYFRF